jgi:hypothetical protein
MAEFSPDGCPAKSVRREDLAEVLDRLQVNLRHPQLRISKPSFVRG